VGDFYQGRQTGGTREQVRGVLPFVPPQRTIPATLGMKPSPRLEPDRCHRVQMDATWGRGWEGDTDKKPDSDAHGLRIHADVWRFTLRRRSANASKAGLA
jgi:hypothetical protein